MISQTCLCSTSRTRQSRMLPRAMVGTLLMVLIGICSPAAAQSGGGEAINLLEELNRSPLPPAAPPAPSRPLRRTPLGAARCCAGRGRRGGAVWRRRLGRAATALAGGAETWRAPGLSVASGQEHRPCRAGHTAAERICGANTRRRLVHPVWRATCPGDRPRFLAAVLRRRHVGRAATFGKPCTP